MSGPTGRFWGYLLLQRKWFYMATNNNDLSILSNKKWHAGYGMTAYDNGSNYSGPSHVGWYVGPQQTRDSDALERSNFTAALEMLGGEDFESGVQVNSVNHWACGWVEQILVREDASEKLAILANIYWRLEDYPALNEDAWIELELDEAQ